jgi:hypothetical protein
VTGLLLLVGAALALEPAQLVGAWTLDTGASEPVLALLEASGVGWVERQALSRLPVEQRFALEGEDLVVRVQTALGERVERLPLRGAPRRGVDRRGEAYELRTRLGGDGFVTTMSYALASGTRTFEIRRTLSADGRTLLQHLALTLPDGRALQARRVFRRSG